MFVIFMFLLLLCSKPTEMCGEKEVTICNCSDDYSEEKTVREKNVKAGIKFLVLIVIFEKYLNKMSALTVKKCYCLKVINKLTCRYHFKLLEPKLSFLKVKF